MNNKKLQGFSENNFFKRIIVFCFTYVDKPCRIEAAREM